MIEITPTISLLEAVQKLLSQNQSFIDVGARLRAIGPIIAGKPAPTINQLVFRQPLRSVNTAAAALASCRDVATGLAQR